jgi:hypothetical protein
MLSIDILMSCEKTSSSIMEEIVKNKYRLMMVGEGKFHIPSLRVRLVVKENRIVEIRDSVDDGVLYTESEQLDIINRIHMLNGRHLSTSSILERAWLEQSVQDEVDILVNMMTVVWSRLFGK